MHINPLLSRQDQCIVCPDPTPCNCRPDQDCFQINRDCNTCSQTKCVDRSSSSSSSVSSAAGVSKGVMAGGIIGALLLSAVAIILFLWYRKRSRRTRAAATPLPKEVPAPAETVLNRPDPAEKPSTPTQVNSVRVYPTSSNSLDSGTQDETTQMINRVSVPPPSNPFEDTHSIQTAVTEGTNVIPIALIAPESLRTHQSSQTSSTTSSSQPTRPPRSPELNINLDHANVSNNSIRARNYAPSARSGVSRNSFMSSASYSSDFLNEAPVIVTPTRTAVRQVLGVVKAEVISAGSSNSDSLKPPTLSTSKLPTKSPLASSSFGPDDIVAEADENQEASNPFGDEQSTRAVYGGSAPVSTFLQASSHSDRESASSDWNPDHPKLPWKGSHQPSSSISTQAGSIIDIGNATRVNLSPGNNPSGLPRSPYRTTMARLVNPASLQEQQRKALAHAHAQAQAQGSDKSRRTSGSSVVSAASRAYSILESFPFVPPSPISDRPVRTPPRSPQGQQSFTPNVSSPVHQQAFNMTPPSPVPQSNNPDDNASGGELATHNFPPPPDRRALGLSTVSTASSGLGSFPFQIETSSTADIPALPTNGRQRASLDTLALTSDLTSYPLGFDRDSVQIPVPALPKKN